MCLMLEWDMLQAPACIDIRRERLFICAEAIMIEVEDGSVLSVNFVHPPGPTSPGPSL